MKTMFVVLVVALAGVGLAVVPEASAHVCQSVSILTLPVGFTYDSSHGVGGHLCANVGNTALLP